MDNDNIFVKKTKKILKKVKFFVEYRDKNILTKENGNKLIYDTIISQKPAAIMRLGSTETNCAYRWMKNITVPKEILERGLFAAGIFPADIEHNAEFSSIYLNAAKSADIMALCGVYKEKEIINQYCPNAVFINARSIEPYYYDSPWTTALSGLRVLIVHPFKKTIYSQYKKRDKLFENNNILPKFGSIEIVQAVQSAAGAKTEFDTWTDALYYMYDEIARKKFDVAIVGAGAYAMPICAYIKSLGGIAIQMSGATQLLFGIKGKRWDDHPYIKNLYNNYWVRANENETPPNISKVEGGSYW